MLARICSLIRMTPPGPELSGKLYSHGKTVPTDGVAGYATGCLFQHTDGGDGTALYVNEGTVSACNFNAVAVGA